MKSCIFICGLEYRECLELYVSPNKTEYPQFCFGCQFQYLYKLKLLYSLSNYFLSERRKYTISVR